MFVRYRMPDDLITCSEDLLQKLECNWTYVTQRIRCEDAFTSFI